VDSKEVGEEEEQEETTEGRVDEGRVLHAAPLRRRLLSAQSIRSSDGKYSSLLISRLQ
jgi:hypothetical protein